MRRLLLLLLVVTGAAIYTIAKYGMQPEFEWAPYTLGIAWLLFVTHLAINRPWHRVKDQR